MPGRGRYKIEVGRLITVTALETVVKTIVFSLLVAAAYGLKIMLFK